MKPQLVLTGFEVQVTTRMKHATVRSSSAWLTALEKTVGTCQVMRGLLVRIRSAILVEARAPSGAAL